MKRICICVLVLLICAALCSSVLADETDKEIVDPFRLYTYEQLTEDLAALAARYPELVKVSSIGLSAEGRDIPLLSLGKGDRDILICAAMHAREYETTNCVMYIAEQYCRAYEADEWYCGLSYRELLNGVRFLIVPMLNPDGVMIAQKGTAYALENPALAAMPITDGWPGNYSCWKANANGVDLNRNWPYYFNNTYKSDSPSSADYAGPEPLSEPETQAMNALIERTPFYSFCSFHSAGNCLYWIDDTNPQELRDKLYPVASRIAKFCGYYLMPNEDISKGGGYMINHVRAATGKPCITVEIGPYIGYYPYQSYYTLRAVIQKAYPIALLLADEALHAAEEPADAGAPPVIPEDETPVDEPAAETGDAPAEETPAEDIRVVLDGVEVAFPDMRPIIENDRVLTPMRAACEAAGLTVEWDGGVVTVTDGTHTVVLTVGEAVISVDGAARELDCAPVLRGGRTMIPIRAVMEPFGFAVEWDGETRTVSITSAQAQAG